MEFYTIKELAKILKVSDMTIRRWIKSGNIPAPTRFARGTLRWEKGVIDKWVSAKNEAHTD